MAKKIDTLVRGWQRAQGNVAAARAALARVEADLADARDAEADASLAAGRASADAAPALLKKAEERREAVASLEKSLAAGVAGVAEAEAAVTETAAALRAVIPEDHQLVRFLAEHLVEDENRADPELRTLHAPGDLQVMPAASVQHFVLRGKVERVEV